MPIVRFELTHARLQDARFPARILLVTATNPCKCGYLGHPRRGCRCTPMEIAQHHARISGPILDRIDIQIEVPALTAEEIQSSRPGEPSTTVRARVLAAREYQRIRGCMNSALPVPRLAEVCALDCAGRRLVTDAVDRAGFSARAVHRALRVARTIADLAGEERVTVRALAEALQYRAYEAGRFAVR
jgi:magnesium chelatase family protein